VFVVVLVGAVRARWLIAHPGGAVVSVAVST
jgi:hypothetical protein